jgi:hypothetical protein
MATQAQCEAALDQLEGALSGAEDVQGVGIREREGGCFLVVYIGDQDYRSEDFPRAIELKTDDGLSVSISVEIEAIGKLRPL